MLETGTVQLKASGEECINLVMFQGTSPDLWPEAKVPAVSPERAAEAKKNYDGADWKFDDLGGDLDSNFAPIRNRLMEGKTYISKSPHNSSQSLSNTKKQNHHHLPRRYKNSNITNY